MEFMLYIGAFFGFMAWMMVVSMLGLPKKVAALEREVGELRNTIEQGKQDRV